jgi:imipenem/basic amino acid-specific outer membrane pore
MSPKGLYNGKADSKAMAFKVGYGIDALKVSAAYSSTDKDGVLSVANVTGSGQSKLYTEAWWNYGFVSAAGADSINLTAEYDAKDLAKFGAYITSVNNDDAGNKNDMQEVTVTASKSFGPLDATAAYVNTKLNGGNRFNTVQAYLTLNF